jgi:hypothetical protein
MVETQTSNFCSLDSESKERELGNRTPLLFETEIPGSRHPYFLGKVFKH